MEKFSAPDRAVCSVTRAVPRHAERRQRHRVFAQARPHVRLVMLHLKHLRVARLQRILRRRIVRVPIRHDRFRRRVIKFR